MQAFRGACARYLNDRRASVAAWLAVMVPGMLVGVSLAVEVGSWEAAQVAVQRSADLSATAGAISYTASNSRQAAATFAARVAQLNGGTGTATPTWNSGTNTLTDNAITVQVVPGQVNSGDLALKVTVQKSIGATLSKAFSSVASYTVTGTSTAELASSTTTGFSGGGAAGASGQPCLLALTGGVTGLTSGNGITFTGSGSMTATNCTMRSNTGLSRTGSGTISANAIYTGGTISQTGSGSISGTEYQSSGQIPDPYATDTTLQNALTAANSATGSGAISCSGGGGSAHCSGPTGSMSCSGSTCTFGPGTYTTLSLTGSGNIVLNPGLFVFTGSVSMTGSGTITGSDITILMAAGSGGGNTVSMSGSGAMTLSAATKASATNGQIPGILFASLTTSNSNGMNGSGSEPFVGVTYVPNGALSYTGSGTSGTPGCLQLIAKTISLTGSGAFDASTCPTYGTVAFTSMMSMIARLVR